MARYGTFKYGGAKYGTSATKDSLSWALEIDWDNDGAYDGTNEAWKMSKLHVKRGRDNFIKPDGAGYEHVKEGEFYAELDNTDERYDPYNTSSPLYPNVAPGCKFRLRVVNDSTGIVHPVMRGRITEIRPLSGGNERVHIAGKDGIIELKDTKVYSGVSGTYAVEDAVRDVLALADWDDASSIQNTSETITYWWAGGRSAYNELNDLADSVLGTFYVSASGTAVFLTRNALTDIALTLDEDEIQRGIALLQPWEVVRNATRVYSNARASNSTVELWRLRDTPSVPAGGSLTIWATYTYNNLPTTGRNIVTPVATTDYTMNTQSDGGGSNLTANFTVTATPYGETCKLVITNNSASSGYITLLKLRGDSIQVTNPGVIEYTNDTSINKYRRREFTLDNRWIQTSNLADDYSEFLNDFLSSPRFFPTVRLKGRDANQFVPDLFHRVTLDLPTKGITGTYSLASIEHDWENPLGNVVLTTFKFEPIPNLSGNYWIFPTTLDTDSYFGF